MIVVPDRLINAMDMSSLLLLDSGLLGPGLPFITLLSSYLCSILDTDWHLTGLLHRPIPSGR